MFALSTLLDGLIIFHRPDTSANQNFQRDRAAAHAQTQKGDECSPRQATNSAYDGFWNAAKRIKCRLHEYLC